MTDEIPLRTALVIGPNGGFGHAAAQALVAHGWTVRGLSRRPPADPRLEFAPGDAANAEDVRRAAEGVQLIVQAANPPGYRDWPRLVPAFLEAALAGARSSGARLVYPASLYNFDPDDGAVIGEASPQNPRTGKGRLRRQVEARLRRASADEGVRVLVLRAGDFFGPPPANGWLNAGMVRAGRRIRSVTFPGRREVGHAWAYLPDLGETLARLVDREAELGAYEVFHFGGHWTERGIEMAEAVRRAAGNPGLPVRPFPWPIVRLLSPFSPTLGGIVEMSWLWRRPLRPDNARLVAFLGEEPHTPFDRAVRTTLQGMGVLAYGAAAH